MLITERNFGIFNIVNIFFAEEPVTENIPVWDVIKFHTNKNWGEVNGFERKKCFTTKIDLNLDIDIIWNKIKRQHKRHIHRAQMKGVNVTLSNNYEEFHQINKKVSKLTNYLYPLELNFPSSQFIQKYGILFIAENQDEILGRNLYFHDGNSALLVSAFQKKENTVENKKLSIDANCFLHWEAMQYFKNQGVINYDLGNLDCDQIPINHQLSGGDYFKRNFGGDISSRYVYRKFKSPLIKNVILLLERSVNT